MAKGAIIHPETVRKRIRVSMLVRRLQDHVEGKIMMTNPQIQAAGILLRKVLPDMVAQTVEYRPLDALADNELVEAINALRTRSAAQKAGEGMADTGELEAPRKLPTVQ